MRENKVTIATLAEILGVSPITVSRALSGQPGVGDELRKKIIDKARELGYNRCKKCRNIDKMNILLLISRPFVKDNSNFSIIIQNIEKYIKKYGARFTLEFIDEEKQEELVLPYNLEKKNRINGVIVLGRFKSEYLNFIRKKVKNMVIFNSYSYEIDCDYVYFNFNRTGYKAAEYLLKKGHKKIGFIGVEGLFHNPQRFLGFCRALERYNVELEEKYLINKKDEMEQKLEVLAGDLPTAFICQSDATALKLIKLLHDRGIAVPEQVSVIGIGNTEMSGLFIPPLTTFDLNIEYACEAAVQLLFNRIECEEVPYRTVYIDTKLVERQSVKDLNDAGG